MSEIAKTNETAKTDSMSVNQAFFKRQGASVERETQRYVVGVDQAPKDISAPPPEDNLKEKSPNASVKREIRSPHPYTPPTEGNSGKGGKGTPHPYAYTPAEGNSGKGKPPIKNDKRSQNSAKTQSKKTRVWAKILIAIILIGLIGGIVGYFLLQRPKTVLGTPEGLKINDKTLTWSAVENAKSYVIDIDGEEKTSGNTSYSLEYLTEAGIYEVKVKAIGDGYLNSEWSEIIKYTVSRALNAPNGLKIEDEILTWNAVEHAESYIVFVGGAQHNVKDTEYSLEYLTAGYYNIRIKAIGDGEIYLNSDWSGLENYIVREFLDAPNGLEINDKLLTWNAVEHAKRYTVWIDGEEYEVTDTEYPLSELAGGIYDVIKVKATGDGEVYLASDWAEIENYFAPTVGLEFLPVDGDKAYSVRGGSMADDENLFIPSEYNGMPVKEIAAYAFEFKLTLKSVFIPDSVTTIGKEAFGYCGGLTSVVIGNSVETIAVDAFRNCSVLENITVSEDNENYKSVDNCLLTKDGKILILGCKNSIIPEGIITIGESAFANCAGLTNIEIPDSVISIEDYAFRNCPSLTNIEIPNNVTSIGYCAFASCTGLTSIEIPNNVETIGDSAFEYCSDLKSVVIGNGVTSIGGHAFFYCTGLESIVIGDGVTSIGFYAFAYCRKLESIEIPDSVTSIGNYAFAYCSKLESITINRSTSAEITALYVHVFDECNVLANIYVPADSVNAYQNATNWKLYLSIIKAI